jgi:hypothetical protein
MAENKDGDLANIDNLEVQALSDDELDAVAGGAEPLLEATDASSCSCSCCAATATNQTQ